MMRLLVALQGVWDYMEEEERQDALSRCAGAVHRSGALLYVNCCVTLLLLAAAAAAVL
jgi:hypothetical protein